MDGFANQGELKAVPEEPGHILLHADGDPADPTGEIAGQVHNGGGRLCARSDLYRWHQMRRVHPVKPHDPLGPRCNGSDSRDGNARGVCGKESLRGCVAIQGAKDLALEA